MIALDSSVRLIDVQFSFSNVNVVPAILKERELEGLDERDERKAREGSGQLVIAPTENTSLRGFELAGYELVDAFYQPRIHPKNPQIIYHAVRFLFARHAYAHPSEGFSRGRDAICEEFRGMCQQAMWRVRAYLNPYFEGGERVQGYYTVSINLEARKPFCSSDGKPIVVWQKDEEGNRLGDAPIPIKANHNLQIVDNVVQLVTA